PVPAASSTEPSTEPSDAAPPAPATEQAKPVGKEKPEKDGFFRRLRRGLGRTSDNLVQGLGTLFLGRKEIDDELLEELESRLLMADVGVEATVDIISRLTQRVSRKELTQPS